MSPQLANLEARLGAVVEPLTSAQTQLTPLNDPGRWSIQQIVEHLLLTYRLTCTTVEKRLTRGRPTRGTPSLSQRAGQFFMLRCGLFPGGRQAPEQVMPSAPSVLHSGKVIVSNLHSDLERMDGLIAQAESRFGPRTQAVSHQIIGPLTAQQWRTFHVVHGLHHLKQINAIRRDHEIVR